MPFFKKGCQRGSIATIVALFGLGVLTLGIFAGNTLVELGTRFLPKAAGPSTLSHYFLPTADSYVAIVNPGSNYGSSSTLSVSGRSGDVKEGYLRFNVSGIGGSVVKAELRITLSGYDRRNGPAVYPADNNWTENGINYDNRPIRIGNIITDLGKIYENRPIAVDVTSVISGDGVYTFALIPTSSDSMSFYSREAKNYKPMLTVTYQMPIPTPTEALPTALTPAPTGLSVTPSPTSVYANGDANEDGFVDGIDYTVWLNNYGKNTINLHKEGDFNRDGKVDGLDYVIFLKYYQPRPTPTTNPIPTLTPVPTCIPLPPCAYGADDGAGNKVYCDLNPSFNWCPRPTLTPTPVPPTPIPTCKPLPKFCIEWNEGVANNVCDWLGTPVYCGLPPCIPRPACLNEVPACAMPETPDMCRPGVPTPTLTPTPSPVPATCNQNCDSNNSSACASPLVCAAVIPFPEPNSSTAPSYFCREPACGYDNTCGCTF